MKKLLLIVLVCVAQLSWAKVQLPSVLASGMVLQQQSDVALWGTADSGAKIVVTPSWDEKKYVARVDSDGHWRVVIHTTAAGGPYTIKISDGEAVVLENILLGEVWMCSGQSNMEMPMRGFDRQPVEFSTNIEIARQKKTTPIRMFISDTDEHHRYLRQESDTPQDDIRGGWFDNSPENVARCSAVAYHFATCLQEVLEVPVGVIISTRGGSRVESWLRGGELYNGRIHPFLNCKIRGFLWYQGESNCNNAHEYASLFKTMVDQWRSDWYEGQQLPFYFVEIAPYNYDNQPNGLKAARLREAQMQASREISHCGMVSTLDLGDPTSIHPRRKKAVGERLALMALAQVYEQKGFGYRSPEYKSMEVAGSKVYINTLYSGNGVCPMWTPLGGFEIAGADRVFHPAKAEVETKTCRLMVYSDEVKEPVAVRYCYKNTPEPSVFNIEGYPLLPFRTDDWNQ